MDTLTEVITTTTNIIRLIRRYVNRCSHGVRLLKILLWNFIIDIALASLSYLNYILPYWWIQLLLLHLAPRITKRFRNSSVKQRLRCMALAVFIIFPVLLGINFGAVDLIYYKMGRPHGIDSSLLWKIPVRIMYNLLMFSVFLYEIRKM